MRRSSASRGLVVAVVAAFTFGTSGALVKPLLESGWSPAAAVTLRALVGGIVLMPIALLSLRGRWDALWRGRYRVAAMGLVGVAATQLAYFGALQRIPVGTAILLEYMAPILLVAVAWALSRRRPELVILAGSVVAVLGLVLVVAPARGATLDALGLLLGVAAMVGCAFYYVLAARPSDGLPPVALAAFGLVLGGAALGVTGAAGILPFTTSTRDVALLGASAPWWLPILLVGIVSTAVAYTANITASELLGSRLASFAGLLEVIAATLYAWLLLGERLTVPQLLGGALILGGIVLVRLARGRSLPVEAPGSSPLPEHVP
ncbi:putative inner membrane transporter YicL [Frondihabitans sp. 762G35]|uniref:EamA family transporter n=1 Tax=Frondihabitans sp. 762G35 TaxID=1446794 RepID=UPI000D216306|nr:DMT family transporter [Frondihabitans sp. 762G35]ARC56662.1 putative inner membrane transporter YicL [Frondihabitans sp. 762G35]